MCFIYQFIFIPIQLYPASIYSLISFIKLVFHVSVCWYVAYRYKLLFINNIDNVYMIVSILIWMVGDLCCTIRAMIEMHRHQKACYLHMMA